MDKRLTKNKWNHWSVKVITFYVLISLFAPLISNDLPLLRIYKGEWTFPFLHPGKAYNFSNDKLEGAFEINALFRYSSGKSDPLNMSFRGPFDKQSAFDSNGNLIEIPLGDRHWLGTNLLGSDLWADIIYGTRISVFISFCATLIASLIALTLGFFAGWLGPGSIKVSLLKTVLFFGVLIFWIHLLINIKEISDRCIGWGVSVFVFILVLKFLLKKPALFLTKWKIFLPVDVLFIRVSELFSTIPRVILVLAFVQFFSSSITSMIFMLALSAWVDLARMVRSELHSIKSKNYIDAAVMSGVVGMRLLFLQMLPNIWPTVIVYMLYTFAGNISIEAGLSFLGFGLPATVKSLGGLIAEGKNNFEAWWMIVFPGIWLSMLIYAMFSLSDRLRLFQFDKK
ncbi:MAG: ABC transporter permease [Bacteroidetes bacterium]|nr:ABC transporter permease [Bacteroidota bacterium]